MVLNTISLTLYFYNVVFISVLKSTINPPYIKDTVVGTMGLLFRNRCGYNPTNHSYALYCAKDHFVEIFEGSVD